MKRKFDRVYQFKITLKDVSPSIWRRIQVPETYTFWDLHVAIQDAMGWTDTHLHEFLMTDPSSGVEVRIGLPDEEFDIVDLPGWELRIARYFSPENRVAEYTYDFGDDWEHVIELEQIIPRQEGVDYPVCLAGERACPPEDCGGVWGYAEFLEAISDPSHEQHDEMLEWVGGEFDPDAFDAAEVSFIDPAAYRRAASL